VNFLIIAPYKYSYLLTSTVIMIYDTDRTINKQNEYGFIEQKSKDV